jgi:hypothetical protein
VKAVPDSALFAKERPGRIRFNQSMVFIPSHFLAFTQGKRGKISNKMARTIRTRERGRVKKIKKLP